jgi:hypothetical protein
MKKLHTLTLIGELQAETQRQLRQLALLRDLDPEMLMTRPSATRWSIAEICEHINLSSGHYFKRLRKVYHDPESRLRFREYFEPGRIGEMSVKAMLPATDGKIGWKMRTLGMFEPVKTPVKKLGAMDELRSMLEGFHELLEVARARGLEGERITSTLGPLLRFRTGDAFRFPLVHQTRHFLQMERVLKELEGRVAQRA